jgi:hypothetical protein
MKKTQVQLPDPLYREVKRLAEQLDWSLAEVLRRGAEYMVQSYPIPPKRREEWTLPEPLDLGEPRVHHSRWRELANQSYEEE